MRNGRLRFLVAVLAAVLTWGGSSAMSNILYRVQVFNATTGAFVRQWNVASGQSAELPTPRDNPNLYALRVDAAGNAYLLCTEWDDTLDDDGGWKPTEMRQYDNTGALAITFPALSDYPILSVDGFEVAAGSVYMIGVVGTTQYIYQHAPDGTLQATYPITEAYSVNYLRYRNGYFAAQTYAGGDLAGLAVFDDTFNRLSTIRTVNVDLSMAVDSANKIYTAWKTSLTHQYLETYQFSPPSTLGTQVQIPISETGITGYHRYLATLADDTIAIADRSSHKVYIVDSAGELLRYWGSAGYNAGHFGEIMAVASATVAGTEYVYVLDWARPALSTLSTPLDEPTHTQYYLICANGTATCQRSPVGDEITAAVTVGAAVSAALDIRADGLLVAALLQDDGETTLKYSRDRGATWTE
jgi:hypothetical protein